MSVLKVSFKRGDTFQLPLELEWVGVTLVPSQLAVRGMLRRAIRREKVCDLDVSVLSVSGSIAVLDVTKPYTDTAAWPLGVLLCDVEVTYGSMRRTTETLHIDVREDITYG